MLFNSVDNVSQRYEIKINFGGIKMAYSRVYNKTRTRPIKGRLRINRGRTKTVKARSYKKRSYR